MGIQPPVGLRQLNNAKVRYICQTPTENQQDPQQAHYATMFDENYGIAVFSAYTLTHANAIFSGGFTWNKWKQTPGIYLNKHKNSS